MKYIKTYENISDWQAVFLRKKFVKALVKFINKIDPSLECSVIKYHSYPRYLVAIVSKANISALQTGWLLTLQKKYQSDEFGTDTILEITIYPHKEFERISEFFKELFHTTHTIAEINISYIDSFIEKLTEENFKDFILRQDTQKYNL